MIMVTIKDVEHIAKLARIRINENNKAEFVEQFNKVLTYIEKLNEVDTTNVPETTSGYLYSKIMREDKVHEGLKRQDLEQLTEHFNCDGFFTVPKII